jgi:L,D-transpeptidase catalytic domain
MDKYSANAYHSGDMVRVVNRRGLLKGGLAAGAALALPARLLAQDLEGRFDGVLGAPRPAAPVPTISSPVVQPTVPAPYVPSKAYIQRILQVAARERDRAGSRLWRTDLVGVADFGQPSSRPRLHFANMENGTVRSFLVAHGKGSDPQHDGWLKNFSNTVGSEATSRGSYLTCEWYRGKYGTSIRLMGLDPDNSMALPRAIVMHPAAYVDPSMIDRWGKIGRSEGCFAMSGTDFAHALVHLSGGRLLFADRIGDYG